MHKYSNVDFISLDEQQIKSPKGPINILLTKKEDEQRKYSLIIQDGEIICSSHCKLKDR